jgi:hypothetical protein
MGGKKTTTSTRLDPASQRHIDAMRRQGLQSSQDTLGMGPLTAGYNVGDIGQMVSQYMNPYTQQVIGGLERGYDQMRTDASAQADQGAIAAGAFGGSRHGVTEGRRLGEIDAAQGSQIAGLLSNQFNTAMSTGLNQAELQRQIQTQQLQDPLRRREAAMRFMQGSTGPTGSTTTTKESGGLGGKLLGGALMLGGTMLGGPLGGAIGSKLAGTAGTAVNMGAGNVGMQQAYNPMAPGGSWIPQQGVNMPAVLGPLGYN